MADYDRRHVKHLNANRKQARSRLLADVSEAKQDLHPRTLATRWIGVQKQKIATTANSSTQFARQNAPYIGLAGAAVIVFAARKSIFRLYQKVRDRALEAKEPKP